MKKLLVAGLLVASVTVLARGYNNYGHMYGGQETSIIRYQDLTPEQEEKLTSLEQKAYKSRSKYMTDIQGKRLEVERMILEDVVDWKKVEKLNEDIARLQGKVRTESMKYSKDVSDITGYEYMSGAEYHMSDSGHHMGGNRHHMNGGGW